MPGIGDTFNSYDYGNGWKGTTLSIVDKITYPFRVACWGNEIKKDGKTTHHVGTRILCGIGCAVLFPYGIAAAICMLGKGIMIRNDQDLANRINQTATRSFSERQNGRQGGGRESAERVGDATGNPEPRRVRFAEGPRLSNSTANSNETYKPEDENAAPWLKHTPKRGEQSRIQLGDRLSQEKEKSEGEVSELETDEETETYQLTDEDEFHSDLEDDVEDYKDDDYEAKAGSIPTIEEVEKEFVPSGPISLKTLTDEFQTKIYGIDLWMDSAYLDDRLKEVLKDSNIELRPALPFGDAIRSEIKVTDHGALEIAQAEGVSVKDKKLMQAKIDEFFESDNSRLVLPTSEKGILIVEKAPPSILHLDPRQTVEGRKNNAALQETLKLVQSKFSNPIEIRYLEDNKIPITDEMIQKVLKERYQDIVDISTLPDRMVIPIGSGQHWTVLYVQKEPPYLYHYDSLATSSGHPSREEDTKLQNVLSVVKEGLGEGVVVDYNKNQDQKEGFSCGPRVINFVRELVKNGNPREAVAAQLDENVDNELNLYVNDALRKDEMIPSNQANYYSNEVKGKGIEQLTTNIDGLLKQINQTKEKRQKQMLYDQLTCCFIEAKKIPGGIPHILRNLTNIKTNTEKAIALNLYLNSISSRPNLMALIYSYYKAIYKGYMMS